MSVRIEWHNAKEEGPWVGFKGYRAGDGSVVDAPLCLFLGAGAFEGTRAEILEMLTQATAAVASAVPDE